jgi:acetate kinase
VKTQTVSDVILVVNAGSTSIKLAVYPANLIDQEQAILWKASLTRTTDEATHVRLQTNGSDKEWQIDQDLDASLPQVLSLAWIGPESVIDDPISVKSVGHRIVHGGTRFTSPTIITDDVFSDISELCNLAPLHQPANIHGIVSSQSLFPDALQVAVFDTAYYASLPLEATLYALPYSWYEQWQIRRYGFHGISHEYCAGKAAALLERPLSDLRMLTCHLGGGASITATAGGKPVATTMGFTPLDGLVMANRSGSIDPGILVHLLESGQCTIAEINNALNHDSGLKGVSGVSGDVRELLRLSASGHTRSALALKLYIRSICMHVASLVPLMGGLDALVFTAGVGENSHYVRSSVCEQLTFLGVKLNDKINDACQGDTDISAQDALTRSLVIHTQEELAIARACSTLLLANSKKSRA